LPASSRPKILRVSGCNLEKTATKSVMPSLGLGGKPKKTETAVFPKGRKSRFFISVFLGFFIKGIFEIISNFVAF